MVARLPQSFKGKTPHFIKKKFHSADPHVLDGAAPFEKFSKKPVDF